MKKQRHPTKRDARQSSLWSYNRKKPELNTDNITGEPKKRHPRKKFLLEMGLRP